MLASRAIVSGIGYFCCTHLANTHLTLTKCQTLFCGLHQSYLFIFSTHFTGEKTEAQSAYFA